VGVREPAEPLTEVSQEALEEIVRRIVEVAQPEKIILFGSAARGKIGPHSDLDLLVITAGPVHCRDLAGDIYMNLHGVKYPVDVIVATPGDVERYKDSHALIYKPALREGKVIYERNAV
jgi:predicted nucleotidyltransferase